MKNKKTINKGVWIFALIIMILAVVGCVATLFIHQWKHAACYFLIITGICLFLYTNKKGK